MSAARWSALETVAWIIWRDANRVKEFGQEAETTGRMSTAWAIDRADPDQPDRMTIDDAKRGLLDALRDGRLAAVGAPLFFGDVPREITQAEWHYLRFDGSPAGRLDIVPMDGEQGDILRNPLFPVGDVRKVWPEDFASRRKGGGRLKYDWLQIERVARSIVEEDGFPGPESPNSWRHKADLERAIEEAKDWKDFPGHGLLYPKLKEWFPEHYQ